MCKNWVATFTVKVTATEFRFIQWNHDYFCYMFSTADCLATSLVWQFIFISLWKGCFSVFKVKIIVKVLTSVNVCPDNISDWSNLVWWCIIFSQSIIQKYHFAMFKVKATIVSTRSSEILKFLQSELAWWYITRQGKTLWKDFLAFTQGVRQRILLGWLWTRLLPLLTLTLNTAKQHFHKTLRLMNMHCQIKLVTKNSAVQNIIIEIVMISLYEPKSVTVTLTLNIATQFLHMTLWLIMMYHHIGFGYKWFSDL